VLQASFFGGDSESVTRSSNALIQAVVASGEFSHKTKVSRDGTDEVRACCVTQWHFLASSSNCLCTFVAGEVTGRTNNTEDTTLSPARHPNQGTNSVLSPTARSRNIIHTSLSTTNIARHLLPKVYRSHESHNTVRNRRKEISYKETNTAPAHQGSCHPQHIVSETLLAISPSETKDAPLVHRSSCAQVSLFTTAVIVVRLRYPPAVYLCQWVSKTVLDIRGCSVAIRDHHVTYFPIQLENDVASTLSCGA
jgi:hypothetical protein